MLRLAASRRGPRNALGHRPEPEVLPLPAETSREARKCCAWQHQGGGNLKCCPCQQKRAARLQSAAPGGVEEGGPETRSGTVQSLKCCPCQQKRAARLESAAPRSIKGGGPETSRNEPRGSKVLRLAASRGGAPKRARALSRA